MTKHSYDKEFKEQAVQYYLDNKDHMTMNEISKNLGIGASTLPWIIHRISKKQRNPTIHTGLRCFGVSPIGCAYMLRLSQRKPSRKRGFTPSQL
ncbi:transposase [Lacticaseibacillus sp. N501-2]|uniref:transposase n=1 Tax=Lacticaseibacillus salsurae TaxID=3367729 RepID=UPI0038B26D9A